MSPNLNRLDAVNWTTEVCEIVGNEAVAFAYFDDLATINGGL